MNKDDWIRQQRQHAGTWQALVGLYAIILGGMILLGHAML